MSCNFYFDPPYSMFLKRYRIGSFLGIVPLMDKDNSQKSQNKLLTCKIIYPIFLMATIVSWYLYEMYTVLFEIESHPTVNEGLQVVLLLLEYASHIIFMSANYLSTIFNWSKWKVFICSLAILGKKIASPENHSNLIKTYIFGIHVIFLIHFFYIQCFALYQGIPHVTNIIRNFMYCFSQYHEIFFVIITNCLLGIIKGKYKILKKTLKQTIQREHHGNISEISFRKHIQEIHVLYTDVVDLVKEFNDIFKWSIFFYFVGICCHIINATALSLNLSRDYFYIGLLMGKLLIPMVSYLFIHFY